MTLDEYLGHNEFALPRAPCCRRSNRISALQHWHLRCTSNVTQNASLTLEIP